MEGVGGAGQTTVTANDLKSYGVLRIHIRGFGYTGRDPWPLVGRRVELKPPATRLFAAAPEDRPNQATPSEWPQSLQITPTLLPDLPMT